MPAFGTLNSDYILDGVRLGDRLTNVIVGPTTKTLGTISSTSTSAPYVPNTIRLANSADVTAYGGDVTLGDLIVDSPNTFTWANGYEVSYFFAASEWDDLTEDSTVWFDGAELNVGGRILDEIKFQNTANFDSPWTVDKMTFRNIPGTIVTTKNITCHGLLDWVLKGTGTLAPWPINRKYLSGVFGFRIIQPLSFSSHGLVGSVRTGGTLDLSGFESQHGFSAVRLFTAKNANIIASLIIHDFYLHDTRSEGFYIGMTSATGEIPTFRNVQIYQGVIARTGTEPVQLQNMNGSDVHNITIYAADIAWKHPFQNFQSTALQWVVNGGENKLRNIIVNGFGINGLMIFSLDPTLGFTIYPQATNESIVSDISFFQGRSSGSYTNNNASGNGITYILRNLGYSHFNNTWDDFTGASNPNYIITKGNLMTDVMTVEDLVHDGSKAVVIETPGDWNVSGTILDPARPLPVHVNDGFDNHPERISEWHEFYAPWLDENTGNPLVPTHWLVDEIAMYVNIATERWEFYKCTTEHDSTATEPPNSPNFGPKLTWDEEGIRSDMGGWTSGDVQSDYPPDDLRLEDGSPYTLLGAQWTTTTTTTTI